MKIMEKIESENNSPKFDRRPWGSFTVLDESESFKVKRIEVLPNKRLSYQKHGRRAEHWFVVQGVAKVT
ncbi:MAG: phosphomannose isomerase type II C-terminal cupin domain, partial [Acidobacteriota bacterium]|nr:phosphomannose isomerase type II C-terminal cupin domain [Acidobacteriota bacterium]